MSKGGGFKSYLNVFQADRDKATFKSYVDIDAEDEEEEPEEVISNAKAFFDASVMPPLLPGEWLVAKGHNVLKYSPFTEKKQGISGMLFVTNFRITFLTGDRSSYDQPGQIQKNLLVSEDDIPLISIDSAFQVSVASSSLSTTRRKKLVHGMTISGQTKYLELHCKDFRLHRFGLVRTPAGEDKKILNAITAFGFPNRPQLLFAMEYGRNSNFKNSDGRNHLYMAPSDWEWELDRLGGITGWEVTQVNERFNLCDCLPESFTMPAKLPVSVMKSDTLHFVDNRPPTWSYTFVNGASLVRMSCLRSDTTMTEVESRAVEAVRLTHSRGRTPTVFDLSKECPTLRDLQWSYEKLKELVVIDSEKDFWSTDLTWFSSLENTKWLQSVQSCLLLAVSATKEMEENERTVILKEAGGRDFSCVVSSLVQLMLDPNSRTLEGFQLLIQKEWVAMAHPFQQRCGLIRSADSLESPVFLLFLDCVWQMLQQFPSSFAFTETYLTTVWDSIYMGLFETFLFNSPHQQKSLLVGMTKTTVPPIYLPSVWKWDFQFGKEYRSFFNNPLYLNKADVYSQLKQYQASVWKRWWQSNSKWRRTLKWGKSKPDLLS
ncbi:myotubularin-related protein 10-B-like isoform X2 [Liolophura sinensis]|uniref:myotubularin-related protein 10-B-like isoform X2 n=1 Tax=Liolophura sinensis TaxID=3198878 RepID=UPI003158261E